ncbi:acyltransferase family protein, partial [Mycobacterium tuberculosis]|nr:acyltransferase family protein [Mycobacterium tuberculosis]
LPHGAAADAVATWLVPSVNRLAVGVDIFFVISGFVMAAAVDRPHPPRWSAFLIRRAARIYPLYWLATLIVLPSALAGWGR